MAANSGVIKLELSVDDKGSVVINKAVDSGIAALEGLKTKTSTVASTMQSAFDSVKSGIRSIVDHLMNWKTALAGLVGAGSLGMMAKNTLGVAASFEDMKTSLDTLTGGRGMMTLNQLNDWAMRMPVNTEKAVQTFIMLQAMGLNPTIQQMTTLVDTMSALGGGSDMLEGIARALGQISLKGVVSAEELNQLAERGVPAFQILRERIGNVKTDSIDASTAIDAIFGGLEERFGGMATKKQGTWGGMVEAFKGYWTEFQRLIMGEGDDKTSLFGYLKSKLGELNEWIDKAQKEGTLKKWGEEIGQTVKGYFENIETSLKAIPDKVKAIGNDFKGWKAGIDQAYDSAVKLLEKLDAAATILTAGYWAVLKGAYNWSSQNTGWQDSLLGPAAPAEAPGGSSQAPGSGGGGSSKMNSVDAQTILWAMQNGYKIQGSGSSYQVVNNFNQVLSRSDAIAIASEMQRQSYRDSNDSYSGGWTTIPSFTD